MPLYQYRCRTCGHDFDIQQSFDDDPLSVCPECQGELRKVFAPVGIAFKGSGFYKTDSRSGSSNRGSGSEGSGDSGGGSGSGGESGGGSNGSGDAPSSAPGTSGGTGTSTPPAKPATPAAPSTSGTD